jgi:hypothetical protein
MDLVVTKSMNNKYGGVAPEIISGQRKRQSDSAETKTPAIAHL